MLQDNHPPISLHPIILATSLRSMFQQWCGQMGIVNNGYKFITKINQHQLSIQSINKQEVRLDDWKGNACMTTIDLSPVFFLDQHNRCHQLSWNCLSFRSTCVHPSFLVRFVLLDLQFYVYVLQIVVCPFAICHLAVVLSVLLRFTDYDYPFGIYKFFLGSN